MDGKQQAAAYAGADFSEPNTLFVRLFQEAFPGTVSGTILDLGCGPADIPILVAATFPGCTVHGVDGAANMLAIGRKKIVAQGLDHRILLIHGMLPDLRLPLPLPSYDAIIANSLLHHLADPMDLWQTIRSYGKKSAKVLVMDLLRPTDRRTARSIVEQYAGDEPAILQEDFYHSLLAAYRVDEVREQLDRIGFHDFTLKAVSDRHFMAQGIVTT